jgi:putative DNA primase/helicase
VNSDVDFVIPLSTFENKDDNHPARHELAWHAFAQRLCRYDERPAKDGRAWSPVTYLPGTTRGKAGVDQVYALVLDIDHAPLPLDLLGGWEYVAHTTFRHTPEVPRWRAVLPLSSPVVGTDWPAFWLRANAFFGGCVDPATKDSSRIFYLPSCPPGAQHEVKQQHGALLDPDELPAVPAYKPPTVQRGGHRHSVLKDALRGWASQFVVDRCERLARMPRDSGRNNACNRTAHLLAGLVAEPLHDLDEHWVLDWIFDACQSNYLVADDGERSVRATIRSGFESGLLRPWSPADQDPLLPSRKYEPPAERPQLYTVQDLRLDIVRMSEVVAEPINWLWRGRLARGKLTLLMGDPGLGKSLITHWLAAQISTGGQWPDGGECERAAAVVFTIEDALADTVKPRLVAAGADMNRVIAVRGVVDSKASLDARMFALEEHLALLEELVVDEGATLVVMDPISAYLGPNVNAHKETDVRRVLGMLGLMAERTGVAVLNVIHLNKGKDIAALNRATGSVAFPAVSRIVLGVVPDPLDQDGERRLLLSLKCNVARKPAGLGYHIESAPSSALLLRVGDEDRPPVLVWDAEPVLDDMSLALDRGSVQERTATEATIAVLAQLFANNSNEKMLSREVRRQLQEAGVSTSGSVMDAAKRQLGIRSWQRSLGEPWYLLPPTRKVGISGISGIYAGARARVLPTSDTGDRGDRGDTGDSPASSIVPENPAESPPSSLSHARARDGSSEQVPLCPLHHVSFDDHECDAL